MIAMIVQETGVLIRRKREELRSQFGQGRRCTEGKIHHVAFLLIRKQSKQWARRQRTGLSSTPRRLLQRRTCC